MDLALMFVAGLFVGAALGAVAVALMVAAGSDRQQARPYLRRVK